MYEYGILPSRAIERDGTYCTDFRWGKYRKFIFLKVRSSYLCDTTGQCLPGRIFGRSKAVSSDTGRCKMSTMNQVERNDVISFC